jgi:hypothetical protein
MRARARVVATVFGVLLAAAMPAPAQAYHVDVLVLVTGTGTIDPGLDATSQPRTLVLSGVGTGFGNHGFFATYSCFFVVEETTGSLSSGSGTASSGCGYVWCNSSVAARSLMTLTLTCPPPSPGSTQTTSGTLSCTLTPKTVNPVTAVDVLCHGWATIVP